MQLTHQNYFTMENKYLSNSKIGDYLKCPNYFYRKDIKGEIKSDATKALVTGSAVDELLTDIKNVTDGKYAVRQFNGTTKEGKIEKQELLDQGKTILTQAEYDEIMGVAIAVSETTAYKELSTHKTQEILQVERKIGEHFLGLCGIPDFYIIHENGLCEITDLKTSRVTDKDKYYYHCLQFGYFRQQAFYQMLLKELHPEITRFESRHLVAGKEKDIYSVHAFILDQIEIERAKKDLERIIEEIDYEKEFRKADAYWDTAPLLQRPNKYNYEDEELL